MHAARNMAGFARDLRFEDLPKEVIETAKALILDQLGCELAGSTLGWGRQTVQYVRDNGGARPESSIVNYGLKTNAQDAAFANASFGRSVEVDDVDSSSAAHLGSIIIPSAIAVGQKQMIDGAALLVAVVAGYEVASRIGGTAKGAMRKGFHPTTLFGPFGAATAAGLILGLEEEALLHALSIACSHASGLMEYSETGGSVNRLHGGIAAYGGVRSAVLAQRGFTGPASFLEGRKGFFKAFSGDASLENFSRGTDQDFRISGIGLRRYCCCGTQNCGLDAVSKIVAEHAFPPTEVESVEVRVTSVAYSLIGTITEPKDMTSAQFSGRYGVALRLVKGGNGFGEYFNEASLNDPDVLGIVRKTNYLLDTSLDKQGGNATRVSIKLRNGTAYEETVHLPRGSAGNPLTNEERLGKFKELAGTVLSKHRVEEIIETVDRLDRLDNVWKLGALLVAG